MEPGKFWIWSGVEESGEQRSRLGRLRRGEERCAGSGRGGPKILLDSGWGAG